MTNKFLISVSALVLGAAMSSAALADDTNTGSLTGNAAFSGDGDVAAVVLNNSEVAVDDSDTLDVTKDNDNVVLSNNVVGSNNTKDVSITKDLTDTFELNKTSTTTKTTNATVALSYQDLGAFVAFNDVKVKADSEGDSATNALHTGDITGAEFTGFAGIQTASANTGLTSANQAATGLGANANISFGSVGQ